MAQKQIVGDIIISDLLKILGKIYRDDEQPLVIANGSVEMRVPYRISGGYEKLADDATFDENETYYRILAEEYVEVTVTESTFDRLKSRLYTYIEVEPLIIQVPLTSGTVVVAPELPSDADTKVYKLVADHGILNWVEDL